MSQTNPDSIPTSIPVHEIGVEEMQTTNRDEPGVQYVSLVHHTLSSPDSSLSEIGAIVFDDGSYQHTNLSDLRDIISTQFADDGYVLNLFPFLTSGEYWFLFPDGARILNTQERNITLGTVLTPANTIGIVSLESNSSSVNTAQIPANLQFPSIITQLDATPPTDTGEMPAYRHKSYTYHTPQHHLQQQYPGIQFHRSSTINEAIAQHSQPMKEKPSASYDTSTGSSIPAPVIAQPGAFHTTHGHLHHHFGDHDFDADLPNAIFVGQSRTGAIGPTHGPTGPNGSGGGGSRMSIGMTGSSNSYDNSVGGIQSYEGMHAHPTHLQQQAQEWQGDGGQYDDPQPYQQQQQAPLSLLNHQPLRASGGGGVGRASLKKKKPQHVQLAHGSSSPPPRMHYPHSSHHTGTAAHPHRIHFRHTGAGNDKLHASTHHHHHGHPDHIQTEPHIAQSPSNTVEYSEEDGQYRSPAVDSIEPPAPDLYPSENRVSNEAADVSRRTGDPSAGVGDDTGAGIDLDVIIPDATLSPGSSLVAVANSDHPDNDNAVSHASATTIDPSFREDSHNHSLGVSQIGSTLPQRQERSTAPLPLASSRTEAFLLQQQQQQSHSKSKQMSRQLNGLQSRDVHASLGLRHSHPHHTQQPMMRSGPSTTASAAVSAGAGATATTRGSISGMSHTASSTGPGAAGAGALSSLSLNTNTNTNTTLSNYTAPPHTISPLPTGPNYQRINMSSMQSNSTPIGGVSTPVGYQTQDAVQHATHDGHGDSNPTGSQSQRLQGGMSAFHHDSSDGDDSENEGTGLRVPRRRYDQQQSQQQSQYSHSSHPHQDSDEGGESQQSPEEQPVWCRLSSCPGNAIIRVYGLYPEVVVLQGVEELMHLYLNHQLHGREGKDLLWIDVELGKIDVNHYGGACSHCYKQQRKKYKEQRRLEKLQRKNALSALALKRSGEATAPLVARSEAATAVEHVPITSAQSDHHDDHHDGTDDEDTPHHHSTMFQASRSKRMQSSVSVSSSRQSLNTRLFEHTKLLSTGCECANRCTLCNSTAKHHMQSAGTINDYQSTQPPSSYAKPHPTSNSYPVSNGTKMAPFSSKGDKNQHTKDVVASATRRTSTTSPGLPSGLRVCSYHDVFSILCNLFMVHPMTVEDILSTSSREKMEIFDDYLFIVLNHINNVNSSLRGLDGLGRNRYRNNPIFISPFVINTTTTTSSSTTTSSETTTTSSSFTPSSSCSTCDEHAFDYDVEPAAYTTVDGSGGGNDTLQYPLIDTAQDGSHPYQQSTHTRSSTGNRRLPSRHTAHDASRLPPNGIAINNNDGNMINYAHDDNDDDDDDDQTVQVSIIRHRTHFQPRDHVNRNFLENTNLLHKVKYIDSSNYHHFYTLNPSTGNDPDLDDVDATFCRPGSWSYEIISREMVTPDDHFHHISKYYRPKVRRALQIFRFGDGIAKSCKSVRCVYHVRTIGGKKVVTRGYGKPSASGVPLRPSNKASGGGGIPTGQHSGSLRPSKAQEAVEMTSILASSTKSSDDVLPDTASVIPAPSIITDHDDQMRRQSQQDSQRDSLGLRQSVSVDNGSEVPRRRHRTPSLSNVSRTSELGSAPRNSEDDQLQTFHELSQLNRQLSRKRSLSRSRSHSVSQAIPRTLSTSAYPDLTTDGSSDQSGRSPFPAKSVTLGTVPRPPTVEEILVRNDIPIALTIDTTTLPPETIAAGNITSNESSPQQQMATPDLMTAAPLLAPQLSISEIPDIFISDATTLGMLERAELKESSLKILVFNNLVLTFHPSEINHLVSLMMSRLDVSVYSSRAQHELMEQGPRWKIFARQFGFEVGDDDDDDDDDDDIDDDDGNNQHEQDADDTPTLQSSAYNFQSAESTRFSHDHKQHGPPPGATYTRQRSTQLPGGSRETIPLAAEPAATEAAGLSTLPAIENQINVTSSLTGTVSTMASTSPQTAARSIQQPISAEGATQLADWQPRSQDEQSIDDPLRITHHTVQKQHSIGQAIAALKPLADGRDGDEATPTPQTESDPLRSLAVVYTGDAEGADDAAATTPNKLLPTRSPLIVPYTTRDLAELSMPHLVSLISRPKVQLSANLRTWLTTSRAIHAILDTLVDSLSPVVDNLCINVMKVEDLCEAVSYEENADLLRLIANSRRKQASVRQRLLANKDILNNLIHRNWLTFINNIEMPYLNDVLDHNSNMISKLNVSRELLDSAQETYLANSNHSVAMESKKMNDIMQTLTSFATIFMPLGIIPGLMGMNCPVPFQAGGIDDDGDPWKHLYLQVPFICIFLLIVILGYLGFLLFKRKGLM